MQELARVRSEAAAEAAKRSKNGNKEGEGATIAHASQENVDPTALFVEAMNTLMPVIGTLGIKRGGTVYQVPIALSPKRRQQYAIKWMIQACRQRKGRYACPASTLFLVDSRILLGSHQRADECDYGSPAAHSSHFQ